MQIGPRIRVGGTVGRVGQNAKTAVIKGYKDTGHAIGDAANNKWVQAATMAALMASGMGAPAAMAIMAAEKGGGGLLKRGGNIGDGLKGAATGAAEGFGAAKLGGLVKGGLGVLTSRMGGGTPTGTPSNDDPLGILDEWKKQQGGGDSSGGAMDWLTKTLGGVSGGDVLSAVGKGVGGYMDAEQNNAARRQAADQFAQTLAQRKSEQAASGVQFDKTLAQRQAEAAQSSGQFDRTTGDAEAQAAVQAQTALNKAPLADQAQALLLARMGHATTTFQPRDWTRNVANVQGAPTGGPSDTLAASRTAAANYKPGAGGINTDTLNLLLAKMRGSSGLAPTPASTAPAMRPVALPPPEMAHLPTNVPSTTDPALPAPPLLPRRKPQLLLPSGGGVRPYAAEAY